jgi:hypothetical protein
LPIRSIFTNMFGLTFWTLHYFLPNSCLNYATPKKSSRSCVLLAIAKIFCIGNLMVFV